MGADRQPLPQEEQEWWRQRLVTGHADKRWFRRLARLIPGNPRCLLCYLPFDGVGGKLLRLTGYGPTRKNPRFCNL